MERPKMKAVIQLSFLLFYIASAYVAGQIKTIQIIQKIQHSSSGEDTVTIGESRTKLDRGLPRFREAKKSSSDLQYRTRSVVNPAPETRILLFIGFPPSVHLPFTLKRSHSRAPPV